MMAHNCQNNVVFKFDLYHYGSIKTNKTKLPTNTRTVHMNDFRSDGSILQVGEATRSASPFRQEASLE